MDGGDARCFLQGGCTSPNQGLPFLRYAIGRPRRETGRLRLSCTHRFFTCACAFFAPGEGRETCSMFHVPETGHVIPPASRDQGDGRKRKEFPETPLQIKTITSAHFSPKCDPPKADTGPFRPQAALSICCDWSSPQTRRLFSPFFHFPSRRV